jgi:hypothetical protein
MVPKGQDEPATRIILGNPNAAMKAKDQVS